MDDSELLAKFISDGSADAMGELIQRNINLVYSAAKRQLSDEHAAHDVTQAVFILLSQKAQQVKGPVAGWLLRTTWFAAKNAKKLAARREFHERQAAKMRPEMLPEPAWEEYSTELDAALAALGGVDRSAVALRYLRGMSLREVGDSLGIGEDAARKRVDRAMGRLRKIISTKAAVPAVAGFAATLGARGTQAAPAQLIQSITGAQIGAAATSIAHGAWVAMVWAQVKIAAIALFTVGVVGICAGTVVVKLAEGQPSAAPAPTGPSNSGHMQQQTVPVVAPTKQEQSILQQLTKRIPAASLPNVPLQESFTFLQDITGLRIQPDWSSLRTIGVEPSTPISFALEDTRLYSILDLILGQAGNGSAIWTVENNAIVISAPGDPTRIVTRAYDLYDLIAESSPATTEPSLTVEPVLIRADRAKLDEDKAAAVVARLTNDVEPGTWNGPGHVALLNRMLLVTQTVATQQKVADYLTRAQFGPGPWISIDARLFYELPGSPEVKLFEKLSTGPITAIKATDDNLPALKKTIPVDSADFCVKDNSSVSSMTNNYQAMLSLTPAAIHGDDIELKFDTQARVADHNEKIDGVMRAVRLFTQLNGSASLADGDDLLVAMPALKRITLDSPPEMNDNQPTTGPVAKKISDRFKRLATLKVYLLISVKIAGR